MANPMLLWFVGYSNITSIAIVTLCFVAMTLFIGFISMNGDTQGQSNVHIGIEETNMVQMSNPFFLELQQPSRKLADGLDLRLSSLLPSKIFVLWGAKIHPFHDLILQPGRHLQRTFVCDNFEEYRDLDILHCDKLEFFEAGDHSIKLQCPDFVSSGTLGGMPRKRYPVAVFIFIPENHILETEAESERESKNYIMTKVSQNSHIISQYVKTSGVPLYSLQPLYLNTDPTQNQQNHHVRGKAQQNQNQYQTSTSGHSSMNSEASERVREERHLNAGDDTAVKGKDKTDKKCCSCGSDLSAEDETPLENCGDLRPRTEDRLEYVCDKCKDSSAVSDGICETKTCEERGITPSERPKSACGNGNKNDEDEPEFPTSNLAECVVCQTHRVRCALLPCRHACVCLGCFRLLYRCPMCRAGIDSYFLLRSNVDGDDGTTEEEDGSEDDMLQDMQQEAVNASFYQTLHRWNDRLNHVLGFR
ncbi:unnamed protein product [Candidula unifasciata]|uniref:RING-type domain-containing protein n=1 Tax=Candidula unifasciata TaxID=100452 RepID=A0A8S3ZA96_9EUPU|nr:unnamed protein product [Candidula unifasciata]